MPTKKKPIINKVKKAEELLEEDEQEEFDENEDDIGVNEDDEDEEEQEDEDDENLPTEKPIKKSNPINSQKKDNVFLKPVCVDIPQMFNIINDKLDLLINK